MRTNAEQPYPATCRLHFDDGETRLDNVTIRRREGEALRDAAERDAAYWFRTATAVGRSVLRIEYEVGGRVLQVRRP